MTQTVSTVMQLFKGSYFSVAAGLKELCHEIQPN